jgi:hypothetical protein
MDRTLEASQWRRSFAAGTIALGLSLGGHFATVSEAQATCPLSAKRSSLAERVGPRIGAPWIAQRVAKAVVDFMLHRGCG